MDSKLEKLIRQNLGNNGELRIKKDLVDSLVDLVKENCQHELEGLTQRLSLRSKSISTSGVSSWNIQNISSHHYSSDDFLLIQRKIKSVCDVAVMEPEFKRIKSRILRICHKISLQSQRSSSETRTSYSSAGSSDTILATSVLSFGQSIKSIDGKEMEYLIKILNSNEDVKAKQLAIKSLMSMPVFGIIRCRSLVGLVNSLSSIIPNRQLFEPSMELLIKLLASNDYRPWTEVMDKINEIYTAVNTSFDNNSVERYQFSDFCYQILSRSSSFYRSFSLSNRSKIISNILSLLSLSSANNSCFDLLSIYSKMDPDANFIKIRLFNFLDRQVFFRILPNLMSNINDVDNMSSCQKCFVFCMLNHFLCYQDLIGHMDLKVIIDHIGLLLDLLFCDKKMSKEIRKMAGKALLQASQSESGANFYFTHLFPSILSIRTYISVQFLINIFKLSEFNPELDREEDGLLREFIRRCLNRRQHTIFSLSMELLMLIYRKNRDLGVSFIIDNNLDDRLDPKNILHSRILFIGRHSQIMWRHYSHIFLVSSNLHLISHQIEINSIEDRRFLAKSIVNFLSREDSTPPTLNDHGPLIQIILLDFNFISDILRSMDFGFLLEERFKQLYAKKNYGFLYNLALILYNPEVLIEVRRQFSIWTRLLQFAQISHSNGIQLDESTAFIKLLILRILMATPSEMSEIKLHDLKNPSIQQLFRPREKGINVIFPTFDFTELQKPMWEKFLDSESQKEWSLKDLLNGYVKNHDVKRSVDSQPTAIPDWIYPFLDYAVGLGKERSRRRLLSRLQNFKFLPEKPDFFVSVLLLTTDFDIDLATEFLLRVPEGQIFWPRSFPSNSGFYEKFNEKTYQFMNKVLSEQSFWVVNNLINDLKVPFYHLVSSWIQRCYLGMLSMDQLGEFIGYQIIFGENFTGYFCIVILQFLSERIDLSEKNLEHFLLPDLSQFALRDYLIEFKKLERIRIHKSD